MRDGQRLLLRRLGRKGRKGAGLSVPMAMRGRGWGWGWGRCGVSGSNSGAGWVWRGGSVSPLLSFLSSLSLSLPAFFVLGGGWRWAPVAPTVLLLSTTTS